MFNNIYAGKRIVVTGNTGFKGSWLTLWLELLGASVVGISKDIPSSPSLFDELGLSSRIDHHFQDINDALGVTRLLSDARPDFVFHLAAQPIVSEAYENPLETLQTNILGTANVLDAMRVFTHRCNAVIITSDKCYDNVEWPWGYREQDALGGKDPYSASKGAAELIAKTYFRSWFAKPESKIRMATARAGNVIGGGDWAVDRVVPDCIRAWSKGESVTIRNPRSTRPWQHVLEPLSGYLRVGQLLAEAPENVNGGAFNFGPNADQNETVLELLNAIGMSWKSGAGGQHQIAEGSPAFAEAGLLKLNCDKALAYLQWRPVLAFAETAAFTGAWYDKFYNGARTDLNDFTIGQIKAYAAAASGKGIPWAQ